MGVILKNCLSGLMGIRRSGMLLLLAGHFPMVLVYFLASWQFPMYRAMLPAAVGLLYLGVRRCGGRTEMWTVSSFLLMAVDFVLVAMGLWTGSAWLVTLGACFCGAACLVARGALTEPRWLFGMVIFLALIVRLPPGLDQRLQQRADTRLTRVSSVILHMAGVLHYVEAGEIRLVHSVMQPSLVRGGLASAWCLLVLGCCFGVWYGRSVLQQLMMLPLSLILGVMTSVSGTVLAGCFSAWFELDVSSGFSGFVYRLNWLFPGAVLVWSGDRLLKFLLDGIPEMQRTVAGKLQPVRENEDGDIVVATRNPVVALWNGVIAPWPSTVAAGMLSAPVYYGQSSSQRGVRHSLRRTRSSSSTEVAGGNTGDAGGLRGWLITAPATVLALTLVGAQLIRLLTLGGSI